MRIVHYLQKPGGWSGGAMALGKLSVPGRPTIWITVGQGPTALAVGAGGGCLDIFTLIYPFFPLSPSLWETARYRLKYCLKGPLNPKPINQSINQKPSIPNPICSLHKLSRWPIPKSNIPPRNSTGCKQLPQHPIKLSYA